MSGKITAYGPLLDAYLTASARLPSILGWDEPRRYLVLTQNPAELRPTGGYAGSYGIVTFDKGRITERMFQDVFLLDVPWDYPFIKGPQELHDYLLGEQQPWQLADANWAPDFPTSARDAIRLYANESGDTDIDGVLAITTYTIDELLKVTGPITLPEHDLTVASGETTLKLLQKIWAAAAGGSTNRKAILGPFAERLFTTLLGLPPDRWGGLLGKRRDLPARPAPPGLVPRPGRPGAGGGQRLRRRRPRRPGRLRLPRGLQRGARLQAQRGDDAVAGPRRPARRRRERPEHARGDLGQPDRGRRGRPVPGASHRGAAADAWGCTSGCWCRSGAAWRPSPAGATWS